MFPHGKMPRKGVFRPYPTDIPNTTNIYVFILFTGVEGKSAEFQEPLDLRSNPLQEGGDDAILPPKGIGYKTPRKLGQRCRRRP